MNNLHLINNLFEKYKDVFDYELYSYYYEICSNFLEKHKDEENKNILTDLYKEHPDIEKLETFYLIIKQSETEKSLRIIKIILIISILTSIISAWYFFDIISKFNFRY